MTENHERSLRASISHASRLIRDCEDVLAAGGRGDPFSRYAGGLTPPQARIAGDYLRRLRFQLLRAMDALGLPPPRPSVDAVRALTTTLIFLDDTFEEMRGRHLRGYGAVAPDAERTLEGVVSDLQALVREVQAFLTGGTAASVNARIEQLPAGHPLTADLRELSRIIADHGLVSLRSALMLIAERVADDTLEVAMVGRVSSGKSSLLNALMGVPLLPTGVLPVTAFPTRLRQGSPAAIHVTDASGRGETRPIDELEQFVTEAHNPGNQKRLTRLLVEYPSDQLPDGVTFVDTPGLGSVATTGALQTFAYLPRCDHATYFLEAAAPLSEEDVGLLAFLRDAEIATTVVLSKADLLGAADLARVQRYVEDQLQVRLGAPVPVRAVSAMPGHAELLRAWIAQDIRPLGAEARGRHLAMLRRRLDSVRIQALRAIERQTTRDAPPAEGTSHDAVAAGVRDVSARLEQARRDSHAFAERREAVVRTALHGAAAALADADTPAQAIDLARAALMRPSQDVAETASHVLRELAAAVQLSLDNAAVSGGTPPPALEGMTPDRETPLVDMPPLPPVPQPPFWTRISRRLRHDWMTRWVHAHWAELVDRAVGAHLAVLTHWFRGAVTELAQEFDSHSRPLLDQLVPLHAGADPQTPATAHCEADIEWLRRSGAGQEPASPSRGETVDTLKRRQA